MQLRPEKGMPRRDHRALRPSLNSKTTTGLWDTCPVTQRLTRILMGSGAGILLMWTAAGVVDILRFHRVEGFLARSHSFLYSGIVLVLAGGALHLLSSNKKQTETRPRRVVPLRSHLPPNLASAAVPDALKETFRASADYVLIVWWGIAVGLALLAVFRVHPKEFFGEPPSPVRLAASMFVLYAYVAIQFSGYGFVGGALLSVGAQLGQRAGMPRISLKILGAIGSCVVTLILVKRSLFMLAGDLASLTVVGFLSFVLPIMFGFHFLVGSAEPKSTARIGIRHWLVLALPVLFFAQWTIAQMRVRWVLNSVHDPRLELVFVKWSPGPEDLSQGFTAEHFPRVTDHEMDLLREMGLHGHLQSQGGSGDAQPASMRAVVVMYRPIHTDVDLPKPLDGDVIYLQTPPGWRKIPDFAVTAPRNIRLSYIAPNSQHSQAVTKYFVDMGLGITPMTTIFTGLLGKGIDARPDAFSWTSEEEKIDPAIGSLTPLANSQ